MKEAVDLINSLTSATESSAKIMPLQDLGEPPAKAVAIKAMTELTAGTATMPATAPVATTRLIPSAPAYIADLDELKAREYVKSLEQTYLRFPTTWLISNLSTKDSNGTITAIERAQLAGFNEFPGDERLGELASRDRLAQTAPEFFRAKVANALLSQEERCLLAANREFPRNKNASALALNQNHGTIDQTELLKLEGYREFPESSYLGELSGKERLGCRLTTREQAMLEGYREFPQNSYVGSLAAREKLASLGHDTLDEFEMQTLLQYRNDKVN